MSTPIIFDLDGTLWDSVATCTVAWNRVVARRPGFARRFVEQDLRGGMGLTADEFRARLFPDLSVEEGTRLQGACFDAEIAALDELGATFYPGVQEGIRRLSAQRPLYIVSNCDGPYLEAFFRVSGLRDCFKDAECHGNTGEPKGHNIRLVLERNRLSKAWYVGDTTGDQKAAAFAGTPFVYARYGFGECTQFELVVDSFADLEREFARGL